MKDYYKILEVNENASVDVINAAYKILVKRYHPDLAKDAEKKMKEEKMKELNAAKEILVDPVKRAKYDFELKKEKERHMKEIIDERVNRESVRVNKKEDPKMEKEAVTSTLIGSFKGFFGLFPELNKNKKLIILCSGLFLIAFLQIFVVFALVLRPQEIKETTPLTIPNVEQKLVELRVGLSKEDVIVKLGKPDSEYSAYLQYGDAKILLNNNCVVGWIDTYEQLPIVRHHKIPNESTLMIGTTREAVLQLFGPPDTYSKDLIVYDDVVIYFEKDVVSNVEYIKK